jgi:hypothetical protein
MYELPVADVDMTSDMVSGISDPFEAIFKRETTDTVMDMLEAKHPDWAETARLCAQRIGYNAIAHRTGVKIGTVKSRMSRTRRLAQAVMLGLLLWLPLACGAARYSTGSNPVRVAIKVGENYWDTWWIDQITTAASATYAQRPLTVTCRSLYADPLPVGECYLFGTVVGGMPSMPSLQAKGFLDIRDGYSKSVRVYPNSRLWLKKGTFVRVRLEVEVKGRGTTSEVTVIGTEVTP